MSDSPNNPSGFTPAGHLFGAVSFRTKRYPVSADNAKALGLAKGDAVALRGGYAVKLDAMGTSGTPKPVLGVVAQPLNSSARPFTFAQPQGGPFLPGSTAGFVDVYIDPFIVYSVQCDASVPAVNIGQLIDVTAGGINTAAGTSKMAVKFATITATSTFPFKIIGYAPTDPNAVMETGVGEASNQDVHVIINQHAFGGNKFSE